MESRIINTFMRFRVFKYLSNSYTRKCFITPRILPMQVKLYSSLASQTENLDNTESIIESISNGNKEIENRLRVLMLEIDVMRHDGMKAPLQSSIRRTNWEYLLTLKSKSARYKYLGYIWKNEKSDENKKIKKEIAKSERLAYLNELKSTQSDDTAIEYSLSKNSMLLRIYESSINRLYNHRLMQSMLYGQKIILDCSYDKYMTVRESSNAAKQLTLLFAENRYHPNPFDLYLCNCDFDGKVMEVLRRNIPTIMEDDFPMNIHAESYMNLFPKEKLVYLTPHCRNDLVYDPDDVYIIGCMVDKANSEPLSVAKAKENKIRMARLPLDRYLQWSDGSGKSLTINQVCHIMLDINYTGDWNHSLRHVPRRKLVNYYNNIKSDDNTDNHQKDISPKYKTLVSGYSSYRKNYGNNIGENFQYKNDFVTTKRQESSPFYKERKKTNNRFKVKSLYEENEK